MQGQDTTLLAAPFVDFQDVWLAYNEERLLPPITSRSRPST